MKKYFKVIVSEELPFENPALTNKLNEKERVACQICSDMLPFVKNKRSIQGFLERQEGEYATKDLIKFKMAKDQNDADNMIMALFGCLEDLIEAVKKEDEYDIRKLAKDVSYVFGFMNDNIGKTIAHEIEKRLRQNRW